ncbi:MAG: M20/M25/M40 family metallo-hydrolase [Desulfurococcaceae archaeon]
MQSRIKERALSLLEDLVSFNTVNDPARGIKPSDELPKYIVSWLKLNGITSKIVESNGYYSVLGFLGPKPPCLGYFAHFDTVPVVRDRWKYDPFKLTVEGNRAYGRGSFDDKANVVAIMVALSELAKGPLECGIVFSFNGDEEMGGSNGAYIIAQALKSQGLLPKYLVNGDGLDLAPIVRRRKIFTVELTVPSKKRGIRGTVKRAKFAANYPISQHAHAAYFIGGVDSHPLIAASVLARENKAYAIGLAGKFVKSNAIPPEVELEYLIPDPNGNEVEVDEGLTQLLNAVLPLSRAPVKTSIVSDYGVSITPNYYQLDGNKHKLLIDVRAMATLSDVEEAFKAVVESIIPEAKVKVETDPGGCLNTSPRSTLVRATLSAIEELGNQAAPFEAAGASDSRYFVPLGVEAIDLGPRGGGVHGDDEYVEVDSLVKLTQIYYKLPKYLCKHC